MLTRGANSVSYAVNKFNVDLIIWGILYVTSLISTYLLTNLSLLKLKSVTKSLRQNQLMGQK